MYVIAYLFGTDWDPEVVANTNKVNKGMEVPLYPYIRLTSNASPFEIWLALMMNKIATVNLDSTAVRQPHQHPVAFVNTVSLDPIVHSLEPVEKEDMVTVDINHFYGSGDWMVGILAAYHLYPFYPLSLGLEYSNESTGGAAKCVRCSNPSLPDAWAGYLRQLRKSIPQSVAVMAAEFGIPSSIGRAYEGPSGRHAGGLTEQQQGKMIAEMLYVLVEEGYELPCLFELGTTLPKISPSSAVRQSSAFFLFLLMCLSLLVDEWFKTSWNVDLPHKQLQIENPGKLLADKRLLAFPSIFCFMFCQPLPNFCSPACVCPFLPFLSFFASQPRTSRCGATW